MIDAKVVAYSESKRNPLDRVVTFELTFPRIILPEILTHRMFSRNTSSSRAIPLEKMIEVVKTNPFIPMAFQKNHKGMQGKEYLSRDEAKEARKVWLQSRDQAVIFAKKLNKENNVTKQLCNRLLEPFMWVKMLVTTSMPGLTNFLQLRGPKYSLDGGETHSTREGFYISNLYNLIKYKSQLLHNPDDAFYFEHSKSTAEIHIQYLAELIYMQLIKKEHTIKKLGNNDWHIPYEVEILDHFNSKGMKSYSNTDLIIYSVAKTARMSYTTIEDSKEMTLTKAKDIYNHCLENKHSSVFEHCSAPFNDEDAEHFSSQEFKENLEGSAYCRNLQGFMPLRYLIETGNF